MSEDTSYYELKWICEESRTFLSKRLFETGAVDKIGNIINKDKWAEIHTERKPYTALWHQYIDKFGSNIQFSNKDFSQLYFNNGNSFLEWDCTNCNFTHSFWWPNSYCFGKSKFSQCNFSESFFALMESVKDTIFFDCDFSKAELHLLWQGTFSKCNFNNAKLYDISLGKKRPFFDNCNFNRCSIIFDKRYAGRSRKEIKAELNIFLSPEQLSSMNIKFLGYPFF